MPKINNKKILIVLGALALVAIGFIVLQISRRGKEPSVSERFQQNLNITNLFPTGSLKINNKVRAAEFDFPDTLPYLRAEKTTELSISNFGSVAAALGFNENPQVFTDIKNGTVSIWSNDEHSLVVTPKIGSVQLSSNKMTSTLIQNAIDKQLGDNDYKSMAEDLLINKMKLNQSELKFIGFTYFKTQSGVENYVKTDKAGAEIIQLNYSEGQIQYPIVTANPDQTQISTQFLRDGSLLTLNANLGFKFQPSLNSYPLKNFDQFEAGLEESILVSLNDNNVNLPDIKSTDIQNIDVERVSLAYLLDLSSQGVVQPVFLLEGSAILKGYGEPVSASLYLPAFEGFSQP